MKSIDEYMAMNYQPIIYKDEDGNYIAEIEELPGCIADGETAWEALDALKLAQRSWLESRIKAGLPVPEPQAMTEINPGDFVKILNLKNDTELNGQYAEVLTGLNLNTVPEHDGVRREALRYGVQLMNSGQTGYIRPENLQFYGRGDHTRRAICLHLFGAETAPWCSRLEDSYE